MKKFFTILSVCAALSAQAQYIPNGSFDSWKSSCGSTEAFGTGNWGNVSKSGEMRQRPGVEPTSWNGSSINQYVAFTEKKSSLVFNDGNAVKLQNIWVGAVGIGSVAPGYITFGTPWVYASTSLNDCDGGTYGGNSFSNKPDAIKGRFKRTDSNNENSYIIAYFWKGTFKSKVGKKGSPTAERNNVDRAVLGMNSATATGSLIAKCNYAFKSTNGGWQEITVPIEYLNNETPEMMNVVISGGDYWTRSNLKENTMLYVDDVQFVYYSELASLTYNGKNYFQSGKTSYTIDEFYDESKLSLTSNGKFAVIEKSFNDTDKILNVKVKGNDYAVNNSSYHAYSIAFKKLDPLAVLKYTPAEEVESLKTITIEYNDEIAGTYNAANATKIYVGSANNKASYSVNGNILTITLDNAITETGEYALTIPSGLITRKVNGEAVTCDGEIRFKVKAATVVDPAVDPVTVVKVTPSGEVESLETITVEYSDEIAGTYNAANATKIYVGSANNKASFSVSGKVLSITLDNAITTPGEYALTIPSGLITRKSNGEAVTCNGEIKFKVKSASVVEPISVVKFTPSAEVESLQTIKVEYSDDIVGTYNVANAVKIYVGSSSNTASFSVSGKVLTITLDNAITTPGEHALTIPSGLITRKVNGEAVTCNGEIKFKVRAALPPVDYTPAFTGAKTRSGNDRWLNGISLASSVYGTVSANTFAIDNSAGLCYNDYSATVVMKAAAGENVKITLNAVAEWLNAYVYVDADKDGFTASIADGSNYIPAGDLVSYSFYNNGGSGDETGWNSIGSNIAGDARSTILLPEFAVPAVPGVYRVRVKLDWCNIDPDGDQDGKFGDFMDNGGQIVDFMLEVVDSESVEPEPKPEVDYTPAFTGTKTKTDRWINGISLSSTMHANDKLVVDNSEMLCYNDYYDAVEMKVLAGETVTASLEVGDNSAASLWMNAYVYIDTDADGFTASIAGGSNHAPAGDLVSYSFYNNGGNSDESGWNSVGGSLRGDARSTVTLPSFTVPTAPGVYRVRVKLDWCNIDPNGDQDDKFGNFMSNGGQIVDFKLVVTDATDIEEVETENEDVETIYDLRGRRIQEITGPGIYIVNGRKVLVK